MLTELPLISLNNLAIPLIFRFPDLDHPFILICIMPQRISLLDLLLSTDLMSKLLLLSLNFTLTNLGLNARDHVLQINI